MAKRSLGICAVAALLVVGCGSTSFGGIGTKIVGNNAAGFQAASKKSALYYGELDAEMLLRTKPATKTPDRPTAPQPIRPKPQDEPGAEESFADDRSEVDAQTGHSLTWLSQLEAVVAGRTDLAEQKAFLEQTPAFQIEEIHRLFDDEIDALAPAAAKIKESSWRNLTPAVRVAQFKAKQRELADQWNQPAMGIDPLP